MPVSSMVLTVPGLSCETGKASPALTTCEARKRRPQRRALRVEASGPEPQRQREAEGQVRIGLHALASDGLHIPCMRDPQQKNRQHHERPCSRPQDAASPR